MKAQTYKDSRRSKKGFLYSFSCLSLLIFILAGCQKSNRSESSGIDVFGLNDQTQEAGQLVIEANNDLKKIRKMHKDNQDKIEEVTKAMNEKKIDEVKKIADDLVYVINDGFVLGDSAISKLEKAQEMNINETYKEYLQIKTESLRKWKDAFEFRRQLAVLLRDEFGTKDKFEIEKVKSVFQEKEENFQKYMQIARELSEKANLIAKESLQNANR
jgi:hypothetical protein